MQLNWLLGLIPKLSKLLGIAWNPFLVSTHQLLARGYSQDCYLNCLLPLKLMEEISQDLDWYHNQYQTSRVHLIVRKTLITVQHQMYALLSLYLYITPHLSHEYCFYLTTILSTMSKLETHAYSYFPFVDNIVAH